MKHLYIVDHFLSFPQSEYGGVWVVIAETDDECYDLIVEHDDGMWEEHYPKITQNIMKSTKVALQHDECSQVLESFTT